MTFGILCTNFEAPNFFLAPVGGKSIGPMGEKMFIIDKGSHGGIKPEIFPPTR